jgi:hypothetical protein
MNRLFNPIQLYLIGTYAVPATPVEDLVPQVPDSFRRSQIVGDMVRIAGDIGVCSQSSSGAHR